MEPTRGPWRLGPDCDILAGDVVVLRDLNARVADLVLAASAPDLARENAVLRKRVEELEGKIAEMLSSKDDYWSLAKCSNCGVLLNCTGSHREHEWVWHQRAEKAEQENSALRKRVEELEISVGSAAMTVRLAKERAEKAEREREEWRDRARKAEDDRAEIRETLAELRRAPVRGDLDAALDWIEHDEEESIPPAGLWQRVKALLEKRRKRG